jgi:hypothetical protein
MYVPLADRGTEGERERERGTHYAILYSLPSLSFSSQYSVVTHHKCMSLLQTEGQRERERPCFWLLGRYSDSIGLDGPGIESRWEARFSALVQTGPETQPASYTMGTGSFLGVKRPGRGVDHLRLASRFKKE